MKTREKLSLEDQKIYLNEILDFDVDNNGVIYDCEGEEFYGYDFNLQFDLSSLAGIIEYAIWQSEERTKRKLKSEIKKFLGL